MKKIHETLYILSNCQHNVELNLKAIDKYQQRGPLFTIHHFTYNLAYYIILETVAFLEEYEKGFNPAAIEPEYALRVKMIRKIVKPILRRINEFKNLKDFRHNIVAHPLRKDGQFVLPQHSGYHIPRTWFEYQVLAHRLEYLFSIIREEFEIEYGEAYWFAEQQKEEVEPKLRGFDDVNADTLKMGDEVMQTAKEFGKDYSFKLWQYNHKG